MSKMMKIGLIIAFVCGAVAGALCQQVSAKTSGDRELMNFLTPEDSAQLNRQAESLYQTLDPLAQRWKNSVVRVCRGNKEVVLGILIAPNRVITKWSDLEQYKGDLFIMNSSGETFAVNVLGGDDVNDVIFLDVPQLKGTPVDFSDMTTVHVGDFLLTVLPQGVAGDFGVVSVEERSLREQDMPYLGVSVDMSYTGGGALVGDVESDSGASQAGLKSGDVLLSVNKQKIDSPFSLRSSLNGVKPGEQVKVMLERNHQQQELTLTVGHRKQMPQFSEKRLEIMNSMGNPMSVRRGDFPCVVQTDMTLSPSNAGALVVNEEGKLVGMALSRAGRTETYILPASILKEGAQISFESPKWTQKLKGEKKHRQINGKKRSSKMGEALQNQDELQQFYQFLRQRQKSILKAQREDGSED